MSFAASHRASDAILRQARTGWRVRTVGVIQPLININACDVTLVP